MTDTLLFRRGYLAIDDTLSDNVPSELASWDETTVGDVIVLSHPDLSITHLSSEGRDLVFLGRVIDPLSGEQSSDTILKILADRLATDRHAFLNALDDLSGRFVLLVNNGDSGLAVQDAAGTRPLFYDTQVSGWALSSHPGILALMGNYAKSALGEEVIDSTEAFFPALASPYAQIDRLTPNTLLELPEGDVTRFFPREVRPRTDDIGTVVEEVADLLTTQMRLWNADTDLLLPVSAGLDSRLSLAASRPIAGDVVYYSWRYPNEENDEAEIASNLCDHLGLEHRIIELNHTPPQEFAELFTKTTSGMSIPGRAQEAYNFLNKYPDGRVELRSNVAEVARTYYRNTAMLLPNRANPTNLTKLYFRVNSDRVLQEFDRYIDVTDLRQAMAYDYDLYDLVYWEHRMGSWLSTWLTDMDLSHETFVVYNNRTLLKKLLSVDESSRANDDLFYRLIQQLWPECLDIPVNPHKKDRQSPLKHLERLGYGVAFRSPLPLFRLAVDKYQKFV